MDTIKQLGSKINTLINPMKDDIKKAVSENPNESCTQICINTKHSEDTNCIPFCGDEKKVQSLTKKILNTLDS